MRKKCLVSLAVIFCVIILLVVINPFFLYLPGMLLGYYEGPTSRTPFQKAHERAVRTFVENEGFGFARFSKKGLWNVLSVQWEGEEFRCFRIRLIGTDPEYGDRFFQDDHPPRKANFEDFKHRDLTRLELEAVEKLRSKEFEVVELRLENKREFEKGAKRVMAPIIATRECLECHSVAEGEMLGAFDYILEPRKNRIVDSTRSNSSLGKH